MRGTLRTGCVLQTMQIVAVALCRSVKDNATLSTIKVLTGEVLINHNSVTTKTFASVLFLFENTNQSTCILMILSETEPSVTCDRNVTLVTSYTFEFSNGPQSLPSNTLLFETTAEGEL